MPKKETKRLVVLILIIDIISVAAFILIFSFAKKLIAESINNENEIKTELKKEDTRILMKEDLALGKMYQEKLNEYMIPSGGTVDFIKILEIMVSNSELKSDIKTVNNEAYDKGNSIGAELLRVNMDVIGGWENIQFFLKSLENYPLKIDTEKLSLSKFSDQVLNEQKTPQWTGNFEFTVVKIKDTK